MVELEVQAAAPTLGIWVGQEQVVRATMVATVSSWTGMVPAVAVVLVRLAVIRLVQILEVTEETEQPPAFLGLQ